MNSLDRSIGYFLATSSITALVKSVSLEPGRQKSLNVVVEQVTIDLHPPRLHVRRAGVHIGITDVRREVELDRPEIGQVATRSRHVQIQPAADGCGPPHQAKWVTVGG